MRKRFRFALGTAVIVRGDVRRRRRIIVKRYLHKPTKDDVYWLDRPVSGMDYWHWSDLERVAPSGDPQEDR
jgi:hypothetical protein